MDMVTADVHVSHFHAAIEWPVSLLPLLHRPCMPQLMWRSMHKAVKRTSLLRRPSSGRLDLTHPAASMHAPTVGRLAPQHTTAVNLGAH